MNENSSPCSNCNQLIEDTKLVLHETYCIRFNIKCERCGQYYDKNDPESHEEDYHKKEKCQYCYIEFDDLSKHKCQKTPKLCLYCELSYPLDQIYQHENQCGSRTEKCQMCQNYVMKRDLNAHYKNCGQETQVREKQIQRRSSFQEKHQNPNDEINEVVQQQKSQQKQSNIDTLPQQVKIKKQVPQQQQQQQQISKIPSKEISFGSIQKQTSLQHHQVSQDNKQKEQFGFDKYFTYKPNRPPSSNSLIGQRPNIKNNKPSISQNKIRQQSNQKQVNPKGEVNNLEFQFEKKKLAIKPKTSNLPPLGKQIQNPKRNLESKNSIHDVRTKSLQSRQQVKRSVQNYAEKKEQIEIEGLRFSEDELMQQQLIYEQLKQQKRDSNFKDQPLVKRQNSNSKAKASIDHTEFADEGDFDQFMSSEERAMQQQILDNYQLNSKKQ